MALALALLPCSFGCDSAKEAPAVVPAAVLVARVPHARLADLKGAVQLKLAAGDEWVAAKDGQSLFPNDKVRTALGASAQVTFANGSVVSLGENALIGIAETRLRPGRARTDLTVLRGRVQAELESTVRQSLSVSTPAATVRAGREIVFQ